MNDGRRVKELGIREVKMVANLDTEVIEGLVVVPVSLGYATTYDRETRESKDVSQLVIQTDESICPFVVNNDNEYPTDFDDGPGSNVPCISFETFGKEPECYRHQCPYFVRVSDYNHLEIICSGNFKK
mgnify:FL=1